MTETLADRMRARMKELHMKALHVAEAAGVGRSFVYDILRGRSADPSGEKLSRVAAVLKTHQSRSPALPPSVRGR